MQATCFLHTGSTYVPAKPWEQGQQGRMVADVALLAEDIQKQIASLLDGHEAAEAAEAPQL